VATIYWRGRDANIGECPKKSQTREPTKGGVKPAHEDTYPAGNNSKPYGDPLRHVIEERQKK
jgi:hypothetical protein